MCLHSSIAMKKLLLIFLLCATSFSPFAVIAQTACTGVTAGKTRPQLEAEQAVCEQEAAEAAKIKASLDQQSASYANDVKALTAKINAAQSNIKAKNIAISNLAEDIKDKETAIGVLNTRIEKGKRAIAEILRKTNDINSYSLVEALLSNKDLSDFFVDIDAYASTENALENLFADLRDTRALTEAEKANLNKKKEAEAAARATIEAAKKEVEKANNEKKGLLAVTESNAKGYAQLVADRQAKAAQIRAILFPLVDSGAIPFGTALQYAQTASTKTGVRPALILGILQQESNLGANVGRCVITDLATGQTKNPTTGAIFSNGIHPTRDLPLLQSILKNLGRDPLSTKVSCPVAGVAGYGGAMGPTQFIPSTWNLLVGKIKAATGKETPDPWSPADAIMAAAILLQGNGAASGTADAERNAACKYYSGKVCSAATHIASYGNSVIKRAATIQSTMIDPLQNL